jgi:hypothetical protein
VSGGAVHDLGYRRYVGTRRPPATRWRVILRNQVAAAWTTWWRYKAWLAAACALAVAVGALMYLWQAKIAPIAANTPIGRDGIDVLLPSAARWLRRIGFLVTMTVGASAIAADTATGAFTFYFSRPVRPIDYLAGKLGGLFVLQAMIQAVPLLALAAFRAGLSSTGAEAGEALLKVPAAIGVGLVGALVYAAVPLGVSALVRNRRNAVLVWVAYHVMVGGLFTVIAALTRSGVGALDLAIALEAVTNAVFEARLSPLFGGFSALPPLGWAIASLAVQVVAAVALAYGRVRAAQQSGIGGGA